MEDVLDLYAEEYDRHYPVVCFDESPYQLVREVRTPLPGAPRRPRRYDYEYQREGSCNLFLFFQPLQSWRHVKVTQRRTAKDYAQCLRELVDVHFPDAILISVVQDNLNIHTGAALYEAFEPKEARRILNKLEFRYTPKHGSWLNMAECEFAILLGQCLDQRIGDIETVQHKAAVWERRRNATKATVNWRFTTTIAREKLKRIYPS
jgi:hypothetical protein